MIFLHVFFIHPISHPRSTVKTHWCRQQHRPAGPAPGRFSRDLLRKDDSDLVPGLENSWVFFWCFSPGKRQEMSVKSQEFCNRTCCHCHSNVSFVLVPIQNWDWRLWDFLQIERLLNPDTVKGFPADHILKTLWLWYIHRFQHSCKKTFGQSTCWCPLKTHLLIF